MTRLGNNAQLKTADYWDHDRRAGRPLAQPWEPRGWPCPSPGRVASGFEARHNVSLELLAIPGAIDCRRQASFIVFFFSWRGLLLLAGDFHQTDHSSALPRQRTAFLCCGVTMPLACGVFARELSG